MSILSLMPADVRAVFACFERCSGIAVRLPSCVMQQQAAVFAKNFELWEMELCFAWAKARISAAESGRERNGMSRLSLQWHRMLGEGGDMSLSAFQQRLGLAKMWAKKNSPALLPKSDFAEPPRAATAVPPDDPDLRARAVAALEEFKRGLAHGS